MRQLRVFGTAGVRGVFNSTQTLEDVYKVALTSAFTFGRGTYGVGWDGRKSSSVLARVVASGVSAAGSEAVLFGMVPTPVTAYASRERACKIGFSVTASHNPPEYSGVKFFDMNGMELSVEDEGRIERALAVDVRKSSADYGRLCEWSPLDQYVQAVVEKFERSDSAMKIVVDCVNGPGALVTPRVLREMGHNVIALNGQTSWRFPSRLPEPTPQTLSDTASMVRIFGANFGFAHDGDADRLVMINSAGEVLPDSVVSIIALRAVQRRSGVVILSENTSTAVEEEALSLGLRVVRSRIGKTFAEIERESAVFASEPSKVVNPDWGMWEDGMYCAALITDALAKNRDLLNTLGSERRWHYRQMNVHLAVDPQVVLRRVEAEFGRFKISDVRSLDGLKIIFDDQSWVMFRPSGTEPKVRIYCESKDEVRLGELLDVAGKVIQDSTAVSARVAKGG